MQIDTPVKHLQFYLTTSYEGSILSVCDFQDGVFMLWVLDLGR